MNSEQRKVLRSVENLVRKSCKQDHFSEGDKKFHIDLIKWNYISTDVIIDYEKRKISMNILLNFKEYKASEPNIGLSFMPFTIGYDELSDFLLSCILRDSRSIEFYISLIAKPERKSKYLTFFKQHQFNKN